MPVINLDAATSRLLSGRSGCVVLQDESGFLIGRFYPEPTDEQRRSEPPPLGEDEMRRREDEEDDYSTAEVVAYLETLDVHRSLGDVGAKRIGSPVDCGGPDAASSDHSRVA